MHFNLFANKEKEPKKEERKPVMKVGLGIYNLKTDSSFIMPVPNSKVLWELITTCIQEKAINPDSMEIDIDKVEVLVKTRGKFNEQ